MEQETQRPCLRVAGLHIEGFRALRRVNWPADGLGWDGRVPDLVMVGGVNGSGKTTLLELIADAARMLRGTNPPLPISNATCNAWIDIEVFASEVSPATFRVVVGDEAFVSRNRTTDTICFTRDDGLFDILVESPTRVRLNSLFSNEQMFARSTLPSVIYLPTDRRLEIPEESYKAPGKLEPPADFFFRFEPATKWGQSLEGVLYSARWADLNAKEENRPEDATHFDSYAHAFETFFGSSKHLVWRGGELFVEIKATGALHPLTDLSSGEKQVLILLGELLRRWRPGSLILIDEPELHFHASWQTKILTMLEQWQKERGGQVIIATQSTHLFRISDEKSCVLLGSGLE